MKKISCLIMLLVLLFPFINENVYAEDAYPINPVGQYIPVDVTFNVPEIAGATINVYGSYEKSFNGSYNFDVQARSDDRNVVIDGVYTFSNGSGIEVDVYYIVFGHTYHYTVYA